MINPLPFPLEKTVVLIGMPGAGKTTVGKKLAARLGVPYADSDQEIELAAGRSVSEIFASFGEPAFRDGERKVIARLLAGAPMVLATGGGAFMNEQTRAVIKERAFSIWLHAPFAILLERVLRTNDRPLLQKGDPATILRGLMETREPVYAQADLTVESDNSPVEETAAHALDALTAYLKGKTS